MLESHLIKDYKNLSELNRNPENPRDIDEKELTMLRKSLDKFGDLSGFVVNVVSGNLVSGNQRSKVLPSVSKIEITERYEKPNAKGTIAIGYVVVDGEKHKYREVLFDEATEKAANIAANQQGGNFNLPALKEWVMELDELSIDLDLLGFKDDFLQTLIAPIHEIDAPILKTGENEVGQMTFILSNEQQEIVNRAMDLANSLGEIKDSINKNKSGNLLARICEVFITQNEHS